MLTDKKSAYTSKILYHFVGRKNPTKHEENWEILRKILAIGCISYAPHDNPDGWGKVGFMIDLSKTLFSQDLIVPTITCYCEIPYAALGIHTGKYGLFGVAFEKQFLVQYGARPVFYLPYSRHDRIGTSIHGANLIRNIERVFRSFAELEDRISDGKTTTSERSLNTSAKSSDQAIEDMHSMFSKDFLAFVKVFDCSLGDSDPENYYMEREWRKYQYLRFEPDQVHKVIVAPGFGDRATKDFPHYADRIVEIQA